MLRICEFKISLYFCSQIFINNVYESRANSGVKMLLFVAMLYLVSLHYSTRQSERTLLAPFIFTATYFYIAITSRLFKRTLSASLFFSLFVFLVFFIFLPFNPYATEADISVHFAWPLLRKRICSCARST